MPKGQLIDWLEPSPADWVDDGVTWRVVLRWADIDGFVECVGVAIEPGQENRRVLSAAVLRRLPIGRLVREARASRYRDAGGDLLEAFGDGLVDEPVSTWLGESAAPWGERPARGKARLDDQHFAQVAQLYSAAVQRGRPPGKAVAEAMHASRPTVTRWLAEARKRGLLPPTTQGRAGAAASGVEEQR